MHRDYLVSSFTSNGHRPGGGIVMWWGNWEATKGTLTHYELRWSKGPYGRASERQGKAPLCEKGTTTQFAPVLFEVSLSASIFAWTSSRLVRHL